MAPCTGELILETQAAFKTALRSGWRMCRICLTSNGVTLSQGGRLVLQVPANLIVGARIKRVRSVLGRKKQVLCLECRRSGGSHKPSRVWLTGKDIHTLREKLVDLAAPLDAAAIERLAPHLDTEAESIVRFLWDRRHATIRELSEHARMPSHMDVLLKIREVINPVAEELLGFPLLFFAPVRHDTFAGENVFYSWWILGAGGDNEVQRPAILVDIFDEADSFFVLACLPCGEVSEVSVSCPAGAVEISCGENLEPVKVSLPVGLDPENYRQTFRNGILELRWDRERMVAPRIDKRER